MEAKPRPEARRPGIIRVVPEDVAIQKEPELLAHILHCLHEQTPYSLPLERFAHAHVVQAPIASGRGVPRRITERDGQQGVFRHGDDRLLLLDHQDDWRTGFEHVECVTLPHLLQLATKCCQNPRTAAHKRRVAFMKEQFLLEQLDEDLLILRPCHANPLQRTRGRSLCKKRGTGAQRTDAILLETLLSERSLQPPIDAGPAQQISRRASLLPVLIKRAHHRPHHGLGILLSRIGKRQGADDAVTGGQKGAQETAWLQIPDSWVCIATDTALSIESHQRVLLRTFCQRSCSLHTRLPLRKVGIARILAHLLSHDEINDRRDICLCGRTNGNSLLGQGTLPPQYGRNDDEQATKITLNGASPPTALRCW